MLNYLRASVPTNIYLFPVLHLDTSDTAIRCVVAIMTSFQHPPMPRRQACALARAIPPFIVSQSLLVTLWLLFVTGLASWPSRLWSVWFTHMDGLARTQ
jgi:hypothetical protein